MSDVPDPLGCGERAVRFLRLLKHPKSMRPGRAFDLSPWQEEIVRRIYGPRHPDGRRVVRNVVILLPRGNRKTSLGAALSLLHLFGPERIKGGQILAAAADQKQARIAWEEASGIIAEDRQLLAATRLVDHKNRITHPKSASVLEAISSDAGTQHGRTPNFVLADELHAWRKRDLWDVMRTGLVKTPESLLVVITTAGRGQENIAHEVVDYARRVASGTVADPATLPILYETPRDADWRDEAVWRAVNPGLACDPPYPDMEGLRQLAREAESRVGDREAFKQLHLNIWLDHSTDPFVDMAIFGEGAGEIDLEALAGSPCWLAVDLSSNGDLTCIVAVWRDGVDGYAVRAWFFCPEDNLRLRADRDGVPYPRWAEDGHITPTPGNVVDFRAVEAKVRELCDTFDVREVAFDPHLARNMLNSLLEDGLPAIEMRQGWVTMAPAVKELERAIVGRRFRHDGNPVLRWCFENVAIHTDSAGNRVFHKGKSRDRIDGAVAAAMAVARASAGDSGVSVYETDDRPDGLLVF